MAFEKNHQDGNEKKTNTGGGCLGFIIVIIAVSLLLGSCNSSGTKTTSQSKYSREYQTNSTYRKNVDSVADTYGVSSQEVDSTIQRLSNGK